MSLDKPCKHIEFCGGCQYNGEVYEDVLLMKNKEVLAALARSEIIAPDEKPSFYSGITPAPAEERFRYRNKMEYTFGDFEKGGDMTLGMHKRGHFMSILTVDECQLVPEDFNRVLRFSLDFCRAKGYRHYNKKNHDGLLRNLIVRKGINTGEILVDIVTASKDGETDFDAEAFAAGLLALDLDGNIVGIMHTINDELADAVNCDEQRTIFGRDYYYEELCELRFKVSVFSFFQTNVKAIERLYTEAVSMLSDLDDKTVYDLFCGTGTISQIVAARAKEVLGVEIVADSVESAVANAELNGISNCRFICGDVFKVLSDATALGDATCCERIDDESNCGEIPHPDVIIVDPPRMGLQTKTVNKIASYSVPEILYISCNPKTLAADLADFKHCGYEPMYMKAYDNFCWTKHCECAVLLQRRLFTQQQVNKDVARNE